MLRILAISPISIAGALIIKGLVHGFEKLGHSVLLYDVRNINNNSVIEFKPDFVIGYDYGHFVVDKSESFIQSLNIPVIHYFADAPEANYSLSGDLTLIDKLQKSSNMVFCWDKSYLDFFQIPAYYLPLGVDMQLYENKSPNIKDIPEIVFVGRPLTRIRQNILTDIVNKYPLKLGIYCYKSHFDKSVNEIKELNLLDNWQIDFYMNSYKGFLETEAELATVYSKASIVLNVTMLQGQNSMNYRVFEVLASKGFLLTDYKTDTAEYFEDKKDLAFYSNTQDMLEKIDFYLNNSTLKNEIINNGHNKISENHTFTHRAQEIIIKLKDTI